jgi:hypothetical protein
MKKIQLPFPVAARRTASLGILAIEKVARATQYYINVGGHLGNCYAQVTNAATPALEYSAIGSTKVRTSASEIDRRWRQLYSHMTP